MHIILSYLYLTRFAVLATGARLPSIDHFVFRFWAFVGSTGKTPQAVPDRDVIGIYSSQSFRQCIILQNGMRGPTTKVALVGAWMSIGCEHVIIGRV